MHITLYNYGEFYTDTLSINYLIVRQHRLPRLETFLLLWTEVHNYPKLILVKPISKWNKKKRVKHYWQSIPTNFFAPANTSWIEWTVPSNLAEACGSQGICGWYKSYWTWWWIVLFLARNIFCFNLQGQWAENQFKKYWILHGIHKTDEKLRSL